MRSKGFMISAVVLVALIVGLTVLSLFLTPTNHEAYSVAETFVNAAATGDDATALPLISDELKAYVAANCDGGTVSGCVQNYTPDEWGNLIKAVYRRSIPDGDHAWDVLLVSTYEKAQGFSGVCIYNRLARADADSPWLVTAWSGFVSCDESNAGLTELRDGAEVANRAP